MIITLLLLVATLTCFVLGFAHATGFGEQPLSKIAIHKTVVSLHTSASVTATPYILGTKVTTSHNRNLVNFSTVDSFIVCNFRVRILNGSLLILIFLIHLLMIGLEFSLLQISSNAYLFLFYRYQILFNFLHCSKNCTSNVW